jgi:hypothetical protein
VAIHAPLGGSANGKQRVHACRLHRKSHPAIAKNALAAPLHLVAENRYRQRSRITHVRGKQLICLDELVKAHKAVGGHDAVELKN